MAGVSPGASLVGDIEPGEADDIPGAGEPQGSPTSARIVTAISGLTPDWLINALQPGWRRANARSCVHRLKLSGSSRGLGYKSR